MSVLKILLQNKTSPNAKKQILGIADDLNKYYSLLLRVVNNEVNPPVDCYAWAGYLACSLFSKTTQLVASWLVARYSDGEMTVNLPI